MLSYEQVNRLSELMNEVVPIHGRGNFPTLEVKLCDLVSLVRTKLEQDAIQVKEIRLNGSGASTVLASDTCNISRRYKFAATPRQEDKALGCAP